MQLTESTSLETQKDAIKRYCAAFGLKLVKIYKDEGVSGAREDRPGQNELRRDAAAHKFGKVVVQETGPLWKEHPHAFHYTQERSIHWREDHQ